MKRFKTNMSTEEKAVETKVETAAAQPEAVVTPTTTEVDYEALLKQKDDELAKVRSDKENYRKGMLIAKGKLPDEDDNSSNGEEDIDSKVARLVQEQFLATKEAQTLADKDRLVAEMAKKNKELTLALKNRGQISTSSGQGSNEDRPEVKTDRILSNDQIKALKAKGWDEKKIEAYKKNLTRGSEMPK